MSSKRIQREYLDVVMNACDLDTWRKIVARAVADALQGDAQARKWLSDYVLGKPPTRTERTLQLPGMDGEAERAQLEALIDSIAGDFTNTP